jgi:isovaleryl-CoA dehydrogenase
MSERQQFGQPIGEFQLMVESRRHVFDDDGVQGHVTLSRRPAIAARRRARTQPVPYSMLRKRRRGWRAKPSQALGGNGYINEYPTGRLWRDAKLYEIGT